MKTIYSTLFVADEVVSDRDEEDDAFDDNEYTSSAYRLSVGVLYA